MIEMEQQTFYFVDTRDNAKSDQPFGIHNADVAKSWTRDYNNGEGPFKPVNQDDVEFQVNRRDLKEADKNTVENQKEATAKNMELVGSDESTVYDDMDKEELKAELDAREIEYKKSGPESTNKAYIELLVADDNK
jgi:hypothetical protein